MDPRFRDPSSGILGAGRLGLYTPLCRLAESAGGNSLLGVVWGVALGMVLGMALGVALGVVLDVVWGSDDILFLLAAVLGVV